MNWLELSPTESLIPSLLELTVWMKISSSIEKKKRRTRVCPRKTGLYFYLVALHTIFIPSVYKSVGAGNRSSIGNSSDGETSVRLRWWEAAGATSLCSF